MTCQQALSLIEDLVDGEVSSSLAAQVQSHLEVCSTCQKEYDQSVQLRQLLRQWSAAEPEADYWPETARLIEAKTVDLRENDHWINRPAPAVDGRSALLRAILSLAASLFVLFSAVLLGTKRSEPMVRINRSEAPILVTAPVSELIEAGRTPLVTPHDQERLAKGMLLMGSPGFLGRFAGLPNVSEPAAHN